MPRKGYDGFVKTSLKVVDHVDERFLAEVTRRILQVATPQKVVLFGSLARHEEHEGSDLDLLIVMKTDLPPHRRAVPFYQALAGLLIPKDILVYTPEEVSEWSAVPEAIVTTALREGRVLYEKQG